MSKQSLAVIAALSAGGGAALTAAVYSLRAKSQAQHQQQPPLTPTPTPTTHRAPSFPAASPPLNLPSTPTTTITTADPNSPVNPSGIFQYGFPGPVSDMAHRSSLVSSYDRRTRNPHWVVEHMTTESLFHKPSGGGDGGGVDRRHSTFREDDAVPPQFRARLADYRRSGYDRGHQVPAADAKWSQRAMDDTFFLSNMCPQVGDGFNRDYWARLEDFCRRLVAGGPGPGLPGRRYPSVRVVTGPLYLPRRDPADGNKWFVRYEMIGTPPAVAVPTHFYKVIFAEHQPYDPSSSDSDSTTTTTTNTGDVALAAFVLPNAPIDSNKPISDFEVPLETVERAAGLEFAANLPPHRRRRLCADTTCALTIREFADKQKAFAKS